MFKKMIKFFDRIFGTWSPYATVKYRVSFGPNSHEVITIILMKSRLRNRKVKVTMGEHLKDLAYHKCMESYQDALVWQDSNSPLPNNFTLVDVELPDKFDWTMFKKDFKPAE